MGYSFILTAPGLTRRQNKGLKNRRRKNTQAAYNPTASWAGYYLKDEKKKQPKLAWETI